MEKLTRSIEHYADLIYIEVLSGLSFLEVIKFFLRDIYDLLIKVARTPAGISERIFGSVDLHLLRKCPCPVLIDRPGSRLSFQRILATLDTDSSSKEGCDELIIQLATSLSESLFKLPG